MRGGAGSGVALLVIDVQNDFCKGGSLECVEKTPEGERHGATILPNIKSLMEFGNQNGWKLIATKDFHPPGHISFASTNNVALFTQKMVKVVATDGKTTEVEQVMWPDHCVQGTSGANLLTGLNETDFLRVFDKATKLTVDSYSGFGDGVDGVGGDKNYDNTGLKDYLDELGVGNVIVCGIATNFCVKATCLDAKKYNYEVIIANDAVVGTDIQGSATAIAELIQAGILSKSTAEIKSTKNTNGN